MINDILVLIGATVLLVIVLYLLIYGTLGVMLFTEKIKYNHKIKHRFDKPPAAKCYCIDCKNHIEERCSITGWIVPDNYFCGSAEPRK